MRLVAVPKNCRSQIAAPNSSACISYRCRKDKGHFCQSSRSDEKALCLHITLRTRGRQAPTFMLCGFPAKGDARCSDYSSNALSISLSSTMIPLHRANGRWLPVPEDLRICVTSCDRRQFVQTRACWFLEGFPAHVGLGFLHRAGRSTGVVQRIATLTVAKVRDSAQDFLLKDRRRQPARVSHTSNWLKGRWTSRRCDESLRLRAEVVVDGFGTQSKIREVTCAIGMLFRPHQEVGKVVFVGKAGERKRRTDQNHLQPPLCCTQVRSGRYPSKEAPARNTSARGRSS